MAKNKSQGPAAGSDNTNPTPASSVSPDQELAPTAASGLVSGLDEPLPIKQALAFMGKCANELRMPLLPMTAGPAEKLRVAMKELRLV